MLYWIITFCVGIYLYVVPNGLIGKFNFSYPENLYVGGIMITISAIAILIKSFLWWKKNKTNRKDK